MKKELVQNLTATFEAHAQQTDAGVEYWLARDLSGYEVADHFADVGKMVDLGSGSQREVDDLMLTRYACYLTSQSCDLHTPRYRPCTAMALAV